MQLIVIDYNIHFRLSLVFWRQHFTQLQSSIATWLLFDVC